LNSELLDMNSIEQNVIWVENSAANPDSLIMMLSASFRATMRPFAPFDEPNPHRSPRRLTIDVFRPLRKEGLLRDVYPQTFTNDCTALYSFLFGNSGFIPVRTIIILHSITTYFYSQPTSLQAILCFEICKYIRSKAPSKNGRFSLLEYMWKEFGMFLALSSGALNMSPPTIGFFTSPQY
jgi:hypothetical protein